MPDFIKTQNSFSNGEVAPEFYALDNVNGLSKLENMDVLAGGGLSRRAGLVHVAALDSEARLISFTVSDGQEYILALSDGKIAVYQGNRRVGMLLAPWSASDIPNVQYAQRYGTMILVHPQYRPYVLSKKNDIIKSGESLTFRINFKFDNETIESNILNEGVIIL